MGVFENRETPPQKIIQIERTMRARKAHVSPIKTTYGIRLSG